MGRIAAFHFPADDLERAAAFYAKIFDWELAHDANAAAPYDTDPARTAGGVAAALIAREETLQHPIPIVEVDDADATLARLERMGGKTAGGRGAFRYGFDPEGNALGLMARNGARTGASSSGPGTIVNFHLPADDVARATAFYGELFGWQLRAFPGEIPYIVAEGATAGGPGIDLAIVRRDATLKAPTPTLSAQWIDDTLALIAMHQGQQASVQDIPGIGRFGYARDCEGNTIAVLQPNLLRRS
ncbi:MAG TPA: VOC family protein [Candidatus Limnocylindria bacterium]|nr:VOC family protein [Candidatus Limnocylindria bacterium]